MMRILHVLGRDVPSTGWKGCQRAGIRNGVLTSAADQAGRPAVLEFITREEADMAIPTPVGH
jgi:hypothetical protein